MRIQEQIGPFDHPQDADARARVSSLIDSELDDASTAATIDALLASDELRRFWLDAHRAGDWIRSEEVVAIGDEERALHLIAVQLADEPSIVAPKNTRGSALRRFWLRTGLSGASIAAALVAVVWVATPFGRSDDSNKQTVASTVESRVLVAKVAASSNAAESGAQAHAAAMMDPDRLSPYLAAHREVTPFAYRGPSARPAAFNVPLSNASSAPQ